MKENVKKILGITIPFILTVVFLYLAFYNVDFKHSLELVFSSSFGWLIVFVVIFFFSHFIRALRWKYILASVKGDIKLKHLFGAVMVGYGLNAIVPRAGEIFRSFFLGRWEGVSRTSIFGTVILERIIDILALAFSVMISVLIYSGDLYSEVSWLKYSLSVVFIANGALIILILLLVILKERFSNIILTLAGKISEKLAEKLGYIFNTLITGLSSLRGMKNYFLTFVLTVLIMLVYAFNSWIAFKMLGMDSIKEVTYGMAWILMTISAFGIIIPTPGGTGSYHLITISVLTGLFAFNQEISSAYALLTHFISYVIFIGSAFFFIHVINKKRAEEGKRKLNFWNVIKKMDDEEL